MIAVKKIDIKNEKRSENQIEKLLKKMNLDEKIRVKNAANFETHLNKGS